jgi:hypothetical protein
MFLYKSIQAKLINFLSFDQLRTNRLIEHRKPQEEQLATRKLARAYLRINLHDVLAPLHDERLIREHALQMVKQLFPCGDARLSWHEPKSGSASW